MKGDNIAERLEALGAEVVQLVRTLPKDKASRHIADQILRSATSGGANYEEARSAQSRRDFVHKVGLAAKELRETRYWLGLICRTEEGLQTEAKLLSSEATELVAILMSSRATAERVGVGNNRSPGAGNRGPGR